MSKQDNNTQEAALLADSEDDVVMATARGSQSAALVAVPQQPAQTPATENAYMKGGQPFSAARLLPLAAATTAPSHSGTDRESRFGRTFQESLPWTTATIGSTWLLSFWLQKLHAKCQIIPIKPICIFIFKKLSISTTFTPAFVDELCKCSNLLL